MSRISQRYYWRLVRDELPPTLKQSVLPRVETVDGSTWIAYYDDAGNRYEHEQRADGSECWYGEVSAAVNRERIERIQEMVYSDMTAPRKDS